jgi:DNA-binding transcriptional MerR regulator
MSDADPVPAGYAAQGDGHGDGPGDGHGDGRGDNPGIDDTPDNGDTSRLRPKKAPNAFRTISEVADDLHIPQHVLRFWETKFPQVKPLKRGGGRRYYRPDDIALLRRISGLLYVQGYTIKGVQRLLREGGGKLSDNIPPPTLDDLAEADTDEAAAEVSPGGDTEPQLPMPGLAAAPAATRQPPRAAPAAARDTGPEQEVHRLRAVLISTLEELEALRALLP